MRDPIFAALRWGVLGLVVLAGGVPTARATTLRWKFRPGETLHYVFDQKGVTSQKLPGGQELKTTSSQTIDLTWAVQGVDGEGVADVTQTIDRVRQRLEGPLGTIDYDSQGGKEPPAPFAQTVLPLFKALLGTPISFKMDSRGVPRDVKVPERLAQVYREAGPASEAAAGMFSEQGLREMIAQTGLEVPQGDLAEGKTWTRQEKHPSPLGIRTIDLTYRYQGPDPKQGGQLEKIGLTAKLEIQPPEGEKPLVKIRSQDSQGTFTFDNAAGHLVDSRVVEKIEMSAALLPNVEVPTATDSTTTVTLVAGGAADASK